MDKNSGRVSLRYLPLLIDLSETANYSWGSAVLGYLYKKLCNATGVETPSIGGMCLVIQLWAWERFTCLAPRGIPNPLTQMPLGYRFIFNYQI